jgi:23S rRNA pseudouridine1911/1915/1917 synthase
MAARLKGAFESRRVKKTYQAIVHGVPPWDETVIDMPLALVAGTRLKIRMAPTEGGLRAVTNVRVISRHRDVALVACEPVTGRQHQIRAHLAAVGHAIVGDKLYAHGDEAFIRWADRAADEDYTDADAEREFGMARQALHAASITFPHPVTGESVTVSAPLPADFSRYLATR